MAFAIEDLIVSPGVNAGTPFAVGDVVFVEQTSPPLVESTPNIFVDTSKTPQQIQVGNVTTHSTIIGTLATETAPSTPANHVIIGTSATTADGQDDVVIGHAAQAGQVNTTNGAVAIGPTAAVGGASTNAGGGVAVGNGAVANNGVAVGAGASCLTGQVAVGASASVTNFAIAVGGNAQALFSRGKGSGAIAMGRNAKAAESTDVVISSNCNTAGGLSTTGGNICIVGSASSNATISGFNNVMIGGGNGESLNNNDKNPNTGAQNNCILIGGGSVAAHDQVILIGRGITSTLTNQCVIGGSFAPIASVIFGNDVVNAAPQNVVIGVTGGTGLNAGGASLTLAGGIATGSGTGGPIVFKTSVVAGSSSTPQALATALTIDNTQVATFNNSPLAPTPAPGDSSTKVATTAFVTGTAPNKVTLFTVSGTFTLPTAYNALRIWLVGGGSGGGSGRVGAAGEASVGGGGGAGGGVQGPLDYPAAAFAGDTQLTITVGTGGAGGVAIAATSTNGNPGGVGGNSSVVGATTATVYGLAQGQTGTGGAGGQAGAGGGGGTAGGGSVFGAAAAMTGQVGGNASATGGVGGTGHNAGNSPLAMELGASGGGAGGGISAANAAAAGGPGGALGLSGVASNPAGGTANGGTGATPPNVPTGLAVGGAGGGGGGGGNPAGGNGGAGGAGALYGAGGGGGGAARNGSSSGAGGAGAAGLVFIEVI